MARATVSDGARNASRISLRVSGPVIVPVKVPAPDTGTGGGAHSTSGAMSSVPSRVRSNEVSSSTRLTRPLTITVASRNGAVRRLSVTWLPSKPMRPFTGWLAVARSPTRARTLSASMVPPALIPSWSRISDNSMFMPRTPTSMSPVRST